MHTYTYTYNGESFYRWKRRKIQCIYYIYTYFFLQPPRIHHNTPFRRHPPLWPFHPNIPLLLALSNLLHSSHTNSHLLANIQRCIIPIHNGLDQPSSFSAAPAATWSLSTRSIRASVNGPCTRIVLCPSWDLAYPGSRWMECALKVSAEKWKRWEGVGMRETECVGG